MKKLTKKQLAENRPIFYFNDDKNSEIRAGGILFYKYNKTNFDLLLTYSRNNYEDFGGCTDENDKNIIDTISREVVEESNNIFNQTEIKKKLEDAHCVYVKHCKYIVYFVELAEDYDVSLFGDTEVCDNFKRTVEWVPYDTINNIKLNFRLKSYNVLNYLKTL